VYRPAYRPVYVQPLPPRYPAYRPVYRPVYVQGNNGGPGNHYGQANYNVQGNHYSR
jgi:hypothetical protein